MERRASREKKESLPVDIMTHGLEEDKANPDSLATPAYRGQRENP